MLIAFTGDPFLAREALLEEARLKGLRGFVPLEPEALERALAGGLFGGGGALLDLRDLEEEEWKALRSILEAWEEKAPILLLDPRPTPARAAFYRNRERPDFPPPKGKDLVRHLENRAKRLGFRLPSGIAQRLAETGGDLEALERELEKLALLDPPLTLEKAEAVLALRPPVSGFDLVESLLRGEAQKAFQRLKALKAQGEEPLRLFGALAWQYGLLFRAWALLQENPRPKEEDLARLEAHPFAARKALELARGLNGERLRAALEALMEGEARAKTGKDPWLALELTLVRLLGLAPPWEKPRPS